MSTEIRWHWDLLPSVILIKILSYLPLSDKISACSTCKSWRSVLFYPKFWKKVTFVFKTSEIQKYERSIFIASATAQKLRTCVLEFESVVYNCLIQADNVLIKLTRNPQIEELVLIPSHCHTLPKLSHPYHAEFSNNNHPFIDNSKYVSEDEEMESSDWCSTCQKYSHQFLERAFKCVESIIVGTRGLKTLTLGCLQDITELSDELLPLLGRHHSSTITTLGLASVKCDPNAYALLHITPDHFASFLALQVLTVDYDYVNDDFLMLWTCPYKTPLMRLVLHVHGIDPSHRGTSELAWHNFRSYNPQCSLILNLLYSYEGVEQLNSGLLRPSMPLVTFRSFFCEWINIPFLRLLFNWYHDTLEHLQIVDTLDNRSWNIISQAMEEEMEGPDPLVMLAWRCKRLRHLSLIGYSYSASSLVAIARLRGTCLKELEIPEDFVEWEETNEPLTKEEQKVLAQDMSEGLNRNWNFTPLSSIHPSLKALGNPDSDQFILSQILQDARPL